METVLSQLWKNAPLSWAIIRTSEITILSQQIFIHPILEIGCGDGFFTSILFSQKKGAVDVGIDNNLDEIRRAQKTGIYKKLICADITQSPLKTGSFQTVFANGVLEHIPDLEKALREIRRVLKPGGILVTTSPTTRYTNLLFYYWLFSLLGFKRGATTYGEWINRVFYHFHLLDKNRWEMLFKKTGFSLIDSTYFNNKFTIFIHDIFLPLALPTKFIKKHTDKMVLFPSLRSFYIQPLHRWIQKLIDIPAPPSQHASIMLIAQKSA